MRYSISEKKALRKLGIDDFRHMTKDKVVKFASMLPYMDPDVAKAALAQFPSFSELASSVVVQYRDVLKEIIDCNAESQKAFYDSCMRILDSLQKELQSDDIDAAERSRIEDKMIELAKMIGEKDSENKSYMLRVYGEFGVAAILVAVLAAAILGVTSRASDDLNDNHDDEDNCKKRMMESATS